MVAETILRPIVLFAIGLALLLISFQRQTGAGRVSWGRHG